MRVLKPLFILGIAADLVIMFCCGVSWLFVKGDWIYDFIFYRSFVQFVTLFVFSLAMTLISCRFIRYFRSKRDVRRIQRCKDWKEIGDSPLSNHIEEVTDTLARHGARAAFSHVERFAQQQQEEAQRANDVINFLLCSLPALGLFGTMLGLSSALSAAFSKGNFGSDSIQMFVKSLGTALDTTVLALICSLVAGSTIWLLNRLEKIFYQQQTTIIHAVSGLDRFNLQLNAIQTASSRSTGNLDAAETARTEEQAFLSENVTTITSRLGNCLEKLEDLARLSIERSTQNNSKDGEQINRANIVEALTLCMNEAIVRIGDTISKHNTESASTVASAFNSFTEAVKSSNIVETVRSALQASVDENMTEVKSNLKESIRRIDELVQVNLEQNGIDKTTLVDTVTSCLEGAMERVGDLIITHNAEAVNTVATILNRFTEAINERIPRELIISYSRNGVHDAELNHVA